MNDPMTALAWAFFVRVGVCVVWLVALVALVAPVQVDVHDCGLAVLAVQGGNDESDCTYHAGARVGAALLAAGVVQLASRPLLRRLDDAAGLGN